MNAQEQFLVSVVQYAILARAGVVFAPGDVKRALGPAPQAVQPQPAIR